jgi:hypothetical protein
MLKNQRVTKKGEYSHVTKLQLHFCILKGIVFILYDFESTIAGTFARAMVWYSKYKICFLKMS